MMTIFLSIDILLNTPLRCPYQFFPLGNNNILHQFILFKCKSSGCLDHKEMKDLEGEFTNKVINC